MAEQGNLDSHTTRLLKWLDAPDPSVNLNAAKAKRYQDTGLWFLRSNLFKEWQAGSRSCLWLQGMPGCGKTVLSSTVVDHISRNVNASHPVLTFFFDFSDSRKQFLDNLIRSLSAQSYTKSVSSKKILDDLFSTCSNGQTQPHLDTLSRALLDSFQQLEKVTIIIDALDECKTRKH